MLTPKLQALFETKKVKVEAERDGGVHVGFHRSVLLKDQLDLLELLWKALDGAPGVTISRIQ